jgi:hypothetical protein
MIEDHFLEDARALVSSTSIMDGVWLVRDAAAGHQGRRAERRDRS